MDTPLVSIVMAAWNEEKHIRSAIDSVLAQSYRHFELIIINDGSTDQTEAIILSYSDPRIRYVKNERNLKLIDSLNKGLSLAAGPYIARMDADDICMPDRLEKQVAFMEAHPEIGISGAQLELFGSATGQMNYPLRHETIKLQLLITSAFGNNVVIFRKSIMDAQQLQFPKGYLHAEDYKCWTSWIMRTQAANLDEALVRYRTHANSVSVQNRSVQRETRNRVRREYLATLFALSTEDSIVTNFYGAISSTRITAINEVLRLNRERKVFNEEQFKTTIALLWYSDCMEKAERGLSVLFKYPLIFKITKAGGNRRWLTVLKHYIALRRTKNA